jgi:hypothetical protein
VKNSSGALSSSSEKLAVRAKPGQAKRVGVGLAIDQQQVRLDVAFPIACPIARKIVIAVAGIQRLIHRQSDQKRLEVIVERSAVTSFGFPLVVAFER